MCLISSVGRSLGAEGGTHCADADTLVFLLHSKMLGYTLLFGALRKLQKMSISDQGGK